MKYSKEIETKKIYAVDFDSTDWYKKVESLYSIDQFKYTWNEII